MPTVILVVDDNDEVSDVTELTPADTRDFLRKARGRRGSDDEACTNRDHAARHFFDVVDYDEPNDRELFGGDCHPAATSRRAWLPCRKNNNDPTDTNTHALTAQGVRLCTKKMIPRIIAPRPINWWPTCCNERDRAQQAQRADRPCRQHSRVRQLLDRQRQSWRHRHHRRAGAAARRIGNNTRSSTRSGSKRRAAITSACLIGSASAN